MNIKGQGHLLTLFKGHSDSTFSNVFSIEISGPIKAKFHVKPPWDEGTSLCSIGPGHMTERPTCPFMEKTFKILSGIESPQGRLDLSN